MALNSESFRWGSLPPSDTSSPHREQDHGSDNRREPRPATVWHHAPLDPYPSEAHITSSLSYQQHNQTVARGASTVSTPNNPTGGDILRSIADGGELDCAVGLSPGAHHSQQRGPPLTPSSTLSLPAGSETIYEGPFLLNNGEASLFRHFIQVWGPLLDSTDESKQFSTCIPYLAKSESPCLMYAIFALVSCQLSRTSDYPLQNSKLYRKKCAQVLVSILPSDPDSAHEASIFATYVLLRVYDHLHIIGKCRHVMATTVYANAAISDFIGTTA